MNKKFSRLLSIALATVCLLGVMAPAAFAASVAEATIDTSNTGSISLYKYDWTNATKDGVWDDSYVSTGEKDQTVNDLLGGTVREGDIEGDNENKLENGDSSYGYAINGVEFSYLKVANIVTFTESANDGHTAYNKNMVLYEMNKAVSADLLLAIGLENGKDAYPVNTPKLDSTTNYYYESHTLVNTLRAALAADPTTVKNALEKYMENQNASAMPLTDAYGYSTVSGLDLGLYLMVETEVPEMVTCTTNPFFVSVPMTSVNGGWDDNLSTTGGNYWIYDVVLYPKNETGIVTLDKTVREAYDDTGSAKHGGSLTDITDGYTDNATSSTGDRVDYQVISTLPTITSNATKLTEYTFLDTLAAGLSYVKGDIKIQWFTSKDCAPSSLVDTWDESSGLFSVEYDAAANTMKISMTANGLAKINTAVDSYTNINNAANVGGTNVKYAGYSNYTMRITYQALLDSDNSFVYGDSANCNHVTLTWRRTSSAYYDIIVDDCHVYSYGIDLTKEFAEYTQEQANADYDKMFGEVKFKVQNASDNYWVKAELNTTEGIYYVTDHVATEEEATIFIPVTQFAGTSKQEYGQIVIKGLEADAYILTEIETADGFTLLKDNIDVVISVADDTNRPCSVYDDEAKLGVYQNDGHYYFEGCPDLPLANIPQVQMAHNFLTASATVDGNAVNMKNDTDPSTHEDTASTNAMVALTVVNTRGYELPETGDFGMLVVTTAGIAMIVSAFGIMLITNKRKKEQQED